MGLEYNPERIAWLIEQISHAEQRDARLKRWQEEIAASRKESAAQVQLYKDQIKAMLESEGILSDQIGDFTVYIQACKPSVQVEVDAETLPEWERRIKVEPNKHALYERMKAGEEVEGCFLEQKETLVIKGKC